MKKQRSLANKAMSAAFVVLGAIVANAESDITPITQTFDGEDVSVGYTVSGLGEFKNEVAVVFTNHTKTATWTVPQDLENVQFLVVGGGGGGGASTEAAIGGGGGGGGCVVTGILKNISLESSVLIKVGNGTKGGTYTAGSEDKIGAAEGTSVAKNSSYFLINGTTNVIAYCGGREMGWRENTKNTSGGYGGSNAGSRNMKGNPDYPNGRNAYVNTANMLCYKSLQSGGGIGYANGPAAAGGGGGATQKGFDSYTDGDARHGGDGGEGLASDITGTLVVYGSGGGGGTTRSCTKYWSGSSYTNESLPGKGGEGAGDGGSYGGTKHKDEMNPGKDALANQGGGGGGGGNKADGGNGGSGIVVLRYAMNQGVVDVAQIEAKLESLPSQVYTGEDLTALPETAAYTVSYGEATPNAVGEYDVIVTLKEGFVWSDDNADTSRTLTTKFTIVQANDEWVSEPSITKTSWSVGDDAGELTPPATKFNADLQVVISKKDDFAETFNSLENLGAGDYVVTWTAVATDNYIAAEGSKTVEFTVVAADAIPPYTLAIGEVTETDRVLSVSGSLSCEASTSKTAEIFAVYTIEGSGETNEVSLAEGVALNGGAFTGTILDLKPGATYSVAVYSKIGEEKSELTEFKTVTVSGAPKDLTAEATFVTQLDKKFIVTGSVTPGVGKTTVTLHYSLNSTDCDSTMNQEVGADGEFSFNIPYENLTDTLSWYVTVANTFNTGTWEGSLDGGKTDTVTTERKEAAQSYYVWTGKGGDNLWTNPLNWDCDNDSCYGYPGVKGIYDYSWVGITSSPSAPIDLGGGTYEFIDNGAFTIEEGVTVEFYNGTLVVNGDKLMNGGAENTIGTAGSVMIFNNVKLDHNTTLIINEGASVVFKGTTTQEWYYKPGTGSLIVRDGILTTEYTTKPASPVSGSEVVISNGVWVVMRAADKGIASVVKFRDGDDRQAQLQLRKSSNSTTYNKLKLQGTYDIKIPATPYETPYVLASLLSANSTCTMKIDATDYSGDARVPLIQFKGALDTVTKTAMETMANTADKLVVTADGEDVKAARNAKLVWDEAEKTLYFQQSSRMPIAPGDDPVTVEAENETDAKNQVDLNVAPPEGLTPDEAKAYEEAFTKDAKDNGDGSWTITAVLADSAKPLIGDSAADAGDAFTVDAENVVITIQNYVKGLNYGVVSADEVAKLTTSEAVVEKATVTDGKITLEKSGDTKFYKVIVDFKEIVESSAQ